MMNVCVHCGEYRADKIIDPEGPFAICPVCGHKHLFIQLPLLFVCGPSGAGKSTVCQQLAGKMDEVVLLEGDILWRAEFAKPEDNYYDFFETWLRLGKNIAQSGRPVVIFNAGSIPENMDRCVEKRYFSKISYLALVCADEILVERLRNRPKWRKSSEELFIEEQLKFNRWFKQAKPGREVLELLDTSRESPEETAKKVELWIREKVGIFSPLTGENKQRIPS